MYTKSSVRVLESAYRPGNPMIGEICLENSEGRSFFGGRSYLYIIVESIEQARQFIEEYRNIMSTGVGSHLCKKIGTLLEGLPLGTKGDKPYAICSHVGEKCQKIRELSCMQDFGIDIAVLEALVKMRKMGRTGVAH